MGAAGKKLRRTTNGYAHWCPACKEVHHYRTDSPQPNGAVWAFNGNLDAPSFTPSMLIRWGNSIPGEEGKHGCGGVCHYFVTNGQIGYCGDCTHAMKGQTVDLPDWPYAEGAYGGVES